MTVPCWRAMNSEYWFYSQDNCKERVACTKTCPASCHDCLRPGCWHFLFVNEIFCTQDYCLHVAECSLDAVLKIARLELERRSFAGQFLRVSSLSRSTKALTPARTWPRASPASPRAPPPSAEPRPPLSESLFVNNRRYFRKFFIQKSLAKNRNTSRTYRIISAANRGEWIIKVAFKKVLSTLPRKSR